METVLERNPTPDVVGLLAGAGATLDLPAPLNPIELDEAVTAILDREDIAGPDERARLRRVRAVLERELADRLAE
jgi:hypothetical protein